MTRITEQIARLQERVQTAADRADRDCRAIQIIAVSKQHTPAEIRAALAAGLTRFGESYIREALPKIAAIEARVEWHFIGNLQSNKAADVAGSFDWAHTVAGARAARRLSARRPPDMGDLQVCIQLRPNGAPDRSGVDDDAVLPLVELLEQLPSIRFRGLMMMPLPGLSTRDLRREFARTRALLDRLNGAGHTADTLSMGMSGDLEAAIMEGSTMVRIGTDIFGPRSND